MKRILLVSGIALFGFATSFAQGKQIQQPVRDRSAMSVQKMDPEQMATKKTDRLDKMVGLDDAQKLQVKEIYLKQAKNNKDRMVARKEEQKEIAAILTPEQNNKMEEMKKVKIEKMKSNENRIQRSAADRDVEQK